MRSFTMAAIQSTDIAATIARAADIAAEALSASVGAVIELSGQGTAVVLHGRGPLTAGASVEADPDLLLSPVSRQPVTVSAAPSEGGRRSVVPGGDRGAALSVLVVVEGIPWGRLLVCDTEPRYFTSADLEAVQMISAVLGGAVERSRVDRGREALSAFGAFALRSPDLNATIDRAVDLVKEVVDVPVGALVRFSPDRRTLVTVVHASAPACSRPQSEYEVPAAFADTLHDRGPLVVIDTRTDDRLAWWPTLSTDAAIACLAPAVRVDGRTWGRLVASDTRPRPFTDREVEVVSAIANVLAAAVQRGWKETSGRRTVLPAGELGRRARATEVALLDRAGVIVWVNRAWEDFCLDNGGDLGRSGVGISYLGVCETADDPLADAVASAIRGAVTGDLPAPIRAVIPCHSPRTARWFDILVSSRLDDEGTCVGATVTLSPAEL